MSALPPVTCAHIASVLWPMPQQLSCRAAAADDARGAGVRAADVRPDGQGLGGPRAAAGIQVRVMCTCHLAAVSPSIARCVAHWMLCPVTLSVHMLQCYNSAEIQCWVFLPMQMMSPQSAV